jgi:peptide deformylase
VTGEIVTLADAMLECMYESDGIGLAAPQIGRSERIITLDVELDKHDPRVFLNPFITQREGEIELDEGCLSLPGLRVKVPRANRVRVVAYTLDGKRVELEAEGLGAVAWQHELDHLNGLLIIDRIEPMARLSLRDQLRRLELEAEEQAHG